MTDRERILADLDEMFGDVLPKHAKETIADFARIDGDDLTLENGTGAVVGLYDEDNPISQAYWLGVIAAIRQADDEDPYA